MGFFDLFKEQQEPTKDNTTYYELDMTSAAYYQDDLKKLVEKIVPIDNDYFADNFKNCQTLYKYGIFETCELNFFEDKKNDHDPNAVSVNWRLRQIGYVPMTHSAQFREWLKKRKIYNPSIVIYDGPIKILRDDNLVTVEEHPFKITLKFFVKNY